MIGHKVKRKGIVLEMLILIIVYMHIDVMGNRGENVPMIHILMWESPHLIPELSNEEDGQGYFIYKECNYINCHISSLQHDIDLKDVDVILFNAMSLNAANATTPSTRLKWQKYVFASNEPSCKSLIPSHYNDFFNLTWTYKLNSDCLWRFFMITDKKDEIIGPTRNMQWIDVSDMDPISNTTEVQLQSKNKAAAWFPSQCKTQSKREEYVDNLQMELEKYALTIDIFGPCGNPLRSIKKHTFYDLVESDYYFYLAFESAICEDYVTEEVLIATNHMAVPIVFGGADYNR